MIKIELNPRQIGIWFPGGLKLHKEPLELVIKREGWKNIPRVPIFRLPEEYNHTYVLIDGHSRHDTATKIDTLLPCNLYERREKIDFERDNLAHFSYKNQFSREGFYEKILKLYIIYEENFRVETNL
ncbi:hypothetical protein J4407_00955 [Candidatus Pacearchaeota archaeon]|nr:hypothetical protein [Candidatus Pacearchaeota archaeon]